MMAYTYHYAAVRCMLVQCAAKWYTIQKYTQLGGDQIDRRPKTDGVAQIYSQIQVLIPTIVMPSVVGRPGVQ